MFILIGFISLLEFGKISDNPKWGLEVEGRTVVKPGTGSRFFHNRGCAVKSAVWTIRSPNKN